MCLPGRKERGKPLGKETWKGLSGTPGRKHGRPPKIKRDRRFRPGRRLKHAGKTDRNGTLSIRLRRSAKPDGKNVSGCPDGQRRKEGSVRIRAPFLFHMP
ncbi:MAG: hypothetical protein C6P37_14475 [Caldibacillus debilis]|uniref:Uncharacterized protein n=1 Tax=Caldibacillus debilis TaxID=301148 RepID=A0A3E0JZP7_9BACI|nr:MAG: hypothetical protein C6P37_14475 [Caldibacillus debilis]